MTKPITVHLQPGETIGQALVRAQLIARESDTITIPPGVRIVGSDLHRARIIERRAARIPFLNYNGDQP